MKTYEEALKIWFRRHLDRQYPGKENRVDWDQPVELDFMFEEGFAYSTESWESGYAHFDVKYRAVGGGPMRLTVVRGESGPESMTTFMRELFAIGWED